MPVKKELITAYHQTTYRVIEPLIDLRIGQYSSELRKLLEVHGCKTWAFITAFNPLSQPTGLKENQNQNMKLQEYISKYPVYRGLGIPDAPNWQPEESFLVIGIPVEDAIELGKKYRQNAIVCGTKGGVAKLYFCVG
jgi:hypothetical protein